MYIMNHFIKVLQIASLALILISCGSSSQLTGYASTQSTSVQESPTQLGIFASSQTPGISIQTPTLIVPTQTSTLTPSAQLEPAQANAEIMQTLQDYKACPPPCYLGVVPGKTTSGELQNIFTRWGISLDQRMYFSAPVYSFDYSFGKEFALNAAFYTGNGLVDGIHFNVDQYKPYEWLSFSPEALLRRNGVPSAVTFLIGSIHEPSPTPWKRWYYMTIRYDQLDLRVEYWDVEIKPDDLIVACPNKDPYRGAYVWLGERFTIFPPEGTPLEEAASMSLQKFHDFVLEGPGACFYLDTTKIIYP